MSARAEAAELTAQSAHERTRVLVLSTVGFTLFFAVWVMFAVVGIPLREELGLSDGEFALLVAIPILTGSILRVPVGILTDRDIVVAVVAKEIDPHTLTVGEVMTGELLKVREQDGITDVLLLMREKGVRRVPVVSRSGALAGIVAIDDVLELVAEEMDAFVHTLRSEHVRETRVRR